MGEEEQEVEEEAEKEEEEEESGGPELISQPRTSSGTGSKASLSCSTWPRRTSMLLLRSSRHGLSDPVCSSSSLSLSQPLGWLMTCPKLLAGPH